jgi:hypothetical protein
MSRTTVEIKNHPTSLEHKLVIVTTSRGYCYAAEWAEPYPTDHDQVIAAFKADKGHVDFRPYRGY